MTQVSPTLFSILKPYRISVIFLLLVTIGANALNLVVPQLISHEIDTFASLHVISYGTLQIFIIIAAGIFLLTYAQSILQTVVSEMVARDLRTMLIERISHQRYSYIAERSSSVLLTNLTSDVDAVKSYVSQAIPSLISSLFLIVGASTLLIVTDHVLGSVVILVIPIIGTVFYFVLKRVRKLFRRSQEAIDWLNKVINESILGAAIIRLFNAQQIEYDKFLAANSEARDIGLTIVRYFATLIPIISFVANCAIVIILGLGGHFVIGGTMTLGAFTAFNTYLSILIFPIIIIGFVSNIIAQASASLARISPIITADDVPDNGEINAIERGDLSAEHIYLGSEQHPILKDVSCTFRPGTRNAILGPTAAGKTQFLMTLIGLVPTQRGDIRYNGISIDRYAHTALHNYVGIVFQDSMLFNTTLRENIAFNKNVSQKALERAIQTAELEDFVRSLPKGLDTIVSERGTSLSGGQKQRIMLARALALEPKILLLDDFTARVDIQTERSIISNIGKNYPDLTLISVTQKIEPIESYDQIIVLMEGEIVGTGTHTALLETCSEYMQLYRSQRSTEHL